MATNYVVVVGRLILNSVVPSLAYAFIFLAIALLRTMYYLHIQSR